MTSSEIPEPSPDRAAHAIDRTVLNTIMRFGLLLLIAGSVLFTILAARPPQRYFGDYPAVIGAPNVVSGERGAALATISVSNVAVVTFPLSWQQSDAVCAAVQVSRTKTPGQAAFNDYVPQIRWNDPYNGIMALDTQSIQSHPANGATLRLVSNTLAGLVSEQTAYQAHWIGQESIAIAPDKVVGGLLCVNFLFADGSAVIPPFFSLTIALHNGYVSSQPAFYFSDHDIVQAEQHPAPTVELPTMPFADYLERAAGDAPFAVQRQPVK